MYKYPILKNFEVTSDFYLNLIELKGDIASYYMKNYLTKK